MTSFHSHPNDPAYLKALHHLWKQNLDQVIRLASKAILADPTDLERWYRLWWEVLVEKKESQGIQDFYHHLNVLEKRIHKKSPPPFVGALREMIHLELGKSVKRMPVKCPTARELKQRLLWRTSESLADSHLTSNQGPAQPFDYFSVTTELRALLISQKFSDLKKNLKELAQWAPDSPLLTLYPLYENIDGQEWERALPLAEALVKSYPEHSNYRFLAGYVAAQAQNFGRAVWLLSGSPMTLDPDYQTTLGYAYAGLGEKENALACYRLAQKARIRLGLPTGDLVPSLVYLDPLPESKNKNWAVCLGDARAQEMVDSDENSLEYLIRPVAQGMTPGDGVFFTRHSSLYPGAMEVLTWYRLTSKRTFDPIEGWVGVFQLQERLPERTYLKKKHLLKGTDHPREVIHSLSSRTMKHILKKEGETPHVRDQKTA
jgi:hypothetical protein